jgi:flagellar basal body rod protein FlgG
MEISGNTAFYAGLSSIQSGQNRVDQAASQIANTTIERSVTSQSSEAQVDRLRGVDRSQQMDLGSDMVQMAQGKFQVDLGAKVVKASDEVLGTIIDTFA